MNYKLIVSKKYPLEKKDITAFSYQTVKNDIGEEFVLEKKTLKAYDQLKNNLKEQGIFVDLMEGYRSFETQQQIIDEYTKKYGITYVKQYVAPVGMSEHHTGLCFDLAIYHNGKRIIENEELLQEEVETVFSSIVPSLAQYGLILRYPKGKEKITGYAYEPWHIRYVGPSTAKLIAARGDTLEEYHEKYHKSGVLLLDKPKGLTSRDVVNLVSTCFDTAKVGHTGTLDPLATGLLVVTLNKATKIGELLTCEDKEYIASVQVGLKTDTYDTEGAILQEANQELDPENLKKVFEQFPRTYEQEVPPYAAVKVKGKKLYDYARRGEVVALPKRWVEIKELELLDVTTTIFTFRTVVSKGTYIRSLIQDIGEKLGLFCTMCELRRTRQGRFSLEDAIKLDDLTVLTPLMSIQDVLNCKTVEVPKEFEKAIKNGHSISGENFEEGCILFEEQGKVIALYQKETGLLKPRKMFS